MCYVFKVRQYMSATKYNCMKAPILLHVCLHETSNSHFNLICYNDASIKTYKKCIILMLILI